MKVAILAGGKGTRLAEQTATLPKPMVEVGGFPILWHIMKIYAAYGYNDFVVALGHKGQVIKDYFMRYHYHSHDFCLDLASGNLTVFPRTSENWKVTLVDTGEEAMTGERLVKLRPHLEEQPFLFTYGDGVANINLKQLVHFHSTHGCALTVTAVHPPARFGEIELDEEGKIQAFREKMQLRREWINGGFFAATPEVWNYLPDMPGLVLETEPMQRLLRFGELNAYPHEGFWQCMDTLRDMQYLNQLWQEGAPWKIW